MAKIGMFYLREVVKNPNATTKQIAIAVEPHLENKILHLSKAHVNLNRLKGRGLVGSRRIIGPHGHIRLWKARPEAADRIQQLLKEAFDEQGNSSNNFSTI